MLRSCRINSRPSPRNRIHCLLMKNWIRFSDLTWQSLSSKNVNTKMKSCIKRSRLHLKIPLGNKNKFLITILMKVYEKKLPNNDTNMISNISRKSSNLQKSKTMVSTRPVRNSQEFFATLKYKIQLINY